MDGGSVDNIDLSSSTASPGLSLTLQLHIWPKGTSKFVEPPDPS
jgi:hypothetical protein